MMVRPFLRWIVSAQPEVKSRAKPIKRIMTRSRIQAHSNNGGRPNPRDEGTTENASFAMRSLLFCGGCEFGRLRLGRESHGETSRGTLPAAGKCEPGSGPRIPGAWRVVNPVIHPDLVGRWNDRLHARCDGANYRSVFRRRRRGP